MKEILERKKKKELEIKLPTIHKIYEFCKSENKTQKDVESKFNITDKDIKEIFKNTQISYGTAGGIFRVYEENMKERENELKELSKEIREESWINKLGLKTIFVNVVSYSITLIIGIGLGYLIGK